MCTYATFMANSEALQDAYRRHPNGNIISLSQTGFSTFIGNMWSGYSSLLGNPPSQTTTAACQFWANKVAVWQGILNSGVNQNTGNPLSAYQEQILNGKIGWAQAMHMACGCPGPPPSVAPSTSYSSKVAQACTFSDVKNFASQIMYPVYSSHPNQPMSVWYNSFLTFQQNMWSNFLQFGCQFYYNRILHFQSQLPNITNAYQSSLVSAKISFLQQMHITCGCGTPPPVAPTNQQFKTLTNQPVASKIIKGIDLKYNDISEQGETRVITIQGEIGANFILEITNEDNSYYNFKTKSFQATKTSLESKLEASQHKVKVKFPSVTDDDHYNIYLYAGENTKHIDYVEARFADGTIDLNNTIGSQSDLVQKIIYQYTDVTLTISAYSATGNTEIASPTTFTTDLSRGKSYGKIPFSFNFNVTTNTKSYRIKRQPNVKDFIAFVTRTVGSAPVQIPGENIYPTVTGTDTVNGAVTSGTSVTMDSAVASKMKVGDRITGNAALNAATVTVVSLDSTNVFTMSQAVAIADGLTLSFSNQMNYRWPLDSIHNLQSNMIIVNDTNVTDGTSISDYADVLTIMEGTELQENIIKVQVPELDTVGKKPTITKGKITTQQGNVVFNKQQQLALAGDTLKIGGYGLSEILRVFGYSVSFTDLKVELTSPTTTTTSSTVGSSSTSVAVASRNGIVAGDSVSGLGIEAGAKDPTVVSGASAAGAGTIVLSAAQELESGVELTFSGSGQTATITGNIIISGVGDASQTIRLDVDKILSII